MPSRKLILAFVAAALLPLGLDAAAAKRRSAQSARGPVQNIHLKLSAPLLVPAGFGIYLTPAIGYEHAVGSSNSWLVDLNYSSPAVDYSSILFTGGFRWWLGPRPGIMQGWYAGPKAYLNMWSYPDITISGVFPFTVKKETKSQIFFGAGGEGGYQWILPNNLMLNAGGELVFPFGTVTGYGTTILIKGAVGYAF